MSEPSKVVHIRGVSPTSREADFQLLAQSFGKIEKFVHVRAKNQVLMQFESISAAENFIEHCTKEQPIVRGSRLHVQFSSHHELTSQESHRVVQSPDKEYPANRILLVTIINPLYPITVDVLSQVFSPHGLVEKIVIFSKAAGLQSLVQFKDESSAASSKNSLQGRNIYDGCCTLDIQYSRLDDLNITTNTELTRDFTNPGLPKNKTHSAGSLFGDASSMYNGRHDRGFNPQGSPSGAGIGHLQIGPALPSAIFGQNVPPGITGTNDNPTLLVSGLNIESVDTNKLFNLFSCYGNVQRIKFLYNKPDHALVEMAEPFQAELAQVFLRGALLFGNKMVVAYSKYTHINPSSDTHDYSTSNLHRFSRHSLKNYRHCCAPTTTLHCSNLPQTVTQDDLTDFLSPHGTIVGARVYDKDSKKQALVEFSSPAEAAEALATLHASEFLGTSIRLAFSKNHAQSIH